MLDIDKMIEIAKNNAASAVTYGRATGSTGGRFTTTADGYEISVTVSWVKARRCLDHSAECSGAVEPRMPLSGTGKSFDRCDFHWNKRLDYQDKVHNRYPDSSEPPEWYDPGFAGEAWNED